MSTCLICNHKTKLLEERDADGMLNVERVTLEETNMVIFNLQERIEALEKKVESLINAKRIARLVGHSPYRPARRKGAR